MSYQITIAGVDRTTDVINQSITIEDAIDDKVNTCTFSLENYSGLGFPDTDDEIIITLASGTVQFGGYIRSISLSKSGSVRAQITCVDYVALLDRNLVHRTYEDMTDKEIIENIVSTYCSGSGITTTNVIETVTISQISFNYIQPSQVLRQLADLTGNSWYLDYDMDIHFFPMTTEAAPFDIDSTNTEYKDLKISKDNSQLKNRVYVRGGTHLSDPTTYEEKGDGEKRQFVLPDKPHDVSVTVNGVSKSVGIKNVDTTGYDWYVNFQEKYIEQDVAGVTLISTDVLAVTYEYDIPILVAQEDAASIIANGVSEFAIFDKAITTTEAARARAVAELTDYANDLVEGSFTTMTEDFRSGKYININLTEYDVNDDYIITKVRAKSLGAGTYEYTVFIASAKTMGIIRFLIELLEANKNLIELDPNESVDELLMVSDSLLSDSILDSLTTDSTGPYATWAVAAELTPSTVAKWDLFQWG